MNRSFAESECVGQAEYEGGPAHVFAAIDAEYHADHRELVVTRKAFLSPDDMEHIGEHLKADWMPEGGCVKSTCDASEASDVARDIFRSWVRHVRDAIPK